MVGNICFLLRNMGFGKAVDEGRHHIGQAIYLNVILIPKVSMLSLVATTAFLGP